MKHTRNNQPRPGAQVGPSPTRPASSSAHLGRPAEALALLLVCAVALFGCASGTTTTSTGAVRPSAEVQAEDTVADILKELSDVYRTARAKHDALAGQEPADVHAARRKVLVAQAAGLRAAWTALGATKTATAGGSLSDVLRPLLKSAPDFITLAVELGVLTPERAEWVRNLLASLPQPRAGA